MRRFHTLRANAEIRNANAEVFLCKEDFIYPLFVIDGQNIKEEISGFFNVFRYTTDCLIEEIKTVTDLGISKILLFPVIECNRKDSFATFSYNKDSFFLKAISLIHERFPEILVFTDVCLCAYTNHGHCGLFSDEILDNDMSIQTLAKIAVSHAQAGANYVSPSAMMDGQVETIREALNKHNLHSTKIMSYSSKYSSSMYGPFREAAQSSPSFGDRKAYQLDYRTIQQGIDESCADFEEGADILMVKPALHYLDIIQRIKSTLPTSKLAAYHVSGEYMMIMAAAKSGYLDEKNAFLEATNSIKRAGADNIISYYSKQLVKLI